MAIEVTGLVRTFKHKENILADPSPEMTAEEVLQFYSINHPELTTSNVYGKINEHGVMEYEFKTTIGTKG